MKNVKSPELRKALEDAWEFDVKHSKCISHSDGQFTGNFWHETYEGFGLEITYYFQENNLIGYEYDVEKNRKATEEALAKIRSTPEYKARVAEHWKEFNENL